MKTVSVDSVSNDEELIKTVDSVSNDEELIKMNNEIKKRVNSHCVHG